jgi:hypothetical protein
VLSGDQGAMLSGYQGENVVRVSRRKCCQGIKEKMLSGYQGAMLSGKQGAMLSGYQRAVLSGNQGAVSPKMSVRRENTKTKHKIRGDTHLLTRYKHRHNYITCTPNLENVLAFQALFYKV